MSGVNLRVTPSKCQREVCLTVIAKQNCEKTDGNLNFEYLIVKCCNESELLWNVAAYLNFEYWGFNLYHKYFIKYWYIYVNTYVPIYYEYI